MSKILRVVLGTCTRAKRRTVKTAERLTVNVGGANPRRLFVMAITCAGPLSIFAKCAQHPRYIEIAPDQMGAYTEAAESHTGADQIVVPEQGLVPNAETATQIAEAVFVAIYGERFADYLRPFRVALRDDLWIVVGGLREFPEGVVVRDGRAFYMEIARADGRVVQVALFNIPRGR